MDIMLERTLELIGTKRGAIKALADYLGISGNNISDWKSGKNKSYRQYAPQIAEYYGVSLDWLSGLSDERGTKKGPANNDEANAIMREIYERPELKALFKTAKNVKAEDIKSVCALAAGLTLRQCTIYIRI